MSITINPNAAPAPNPPGGPKARKPIVKKNQSYDFSTPEEAKGPRGIDTARHGSVIDQVGVKKAFSGDPHLTYVLNEYMDYVTGARVYWNKGDKSARPASGARFGFLGLLARSLPQAQVFDHPLLEKIFGTTACMESCGRMWFHADFLRRCMAEEDRGETVIMPVLLHEISHAALEHGMRMRHYPRMLANVAMDIVINKMLREFFPQGTRYSPTWLSLPGIGPEYARFDNMSEETVARVLIDEHNERRRMRGHIHVKTLLIQDGPVDPDKPTVHKAAFGTRLELDTVTVNVMDTPMGDFCDTVFDCATMTVDEIINTCEPRKRQAGPSMPQSQKEDHPIQVPTEVFGKPPPGDGDENDADSDPNGPDQDGNPSKGKGKGKRQDKKKGSDKGSPDSGGAGDEGEDPADDTEEGKGRGKGQDKDDADGADGDAFKSSDHVIPTDEAARKMREAGFGHLVDEMKMDNFDERDIQRKIEEKMDEAATERLQASGGYPGAHIEDFVKNVVKPARMYSVEWQRSIESFILGSGAGRARTWDEYHPIAFVSHEDMGMDHEVLLPGEVPQAPSDAIAFVVDSSASVSDRKLAALVSFAFACKMSAGDMAPRVIFFSADTAVRGEPIELNEDTADELFAKGIKVGGRGGTDFVDPINTICAWAEQESVKLRGIIYATDLGAPVPNEAELHEKSPKLMFAAVPKDVSAYDDFKRALAQNFDRVQAELIQIDSAISISLDGKSQSAKATSRALPA